MGSAKRCAAEQWRYTPTKRPAKALNLLFSVMAFKYQRDDSTYDDNAVVCSTARNATEF